jgi:hypothetical protein
MVTYLLVEALPGVRQVPLGVDVRLTAIVPLLARGDNGLAQGLATPATIRQHHPHTVNVQNEEETPCQRAHVDVG